MTCGRALFAGPGALRALAADGVSATSSRSATGAVEIVLPRAAYVRLGQDWLLLAEPSVPFGPLSVSVHRLAELSLKPGWPARVARGQLWVGQAAVSLERVRERTLPVPELPPIPGDRAAAAAIAAADAELPAAPPSLSRGMSALARGQLAGAIAQLAGRGSGLTPAGDDVLAGYAAGQYALAARRGGSRQAARAPRWSIGLSLRAANHSSPIGLAYLRCAERGELPGPAARLLGVVASGSVQDVPTACAELRCWGASSGIALGWGIITSLAAPIADQIDRESSDATGGAYK